MDLILTSDNFGQALSSMTMSKAKYLMIKDDTLRDTAPGYLTAYQVMQAFGVQGEEGIEPFESGDYFVIAQQDGSVAGMKRGDVAELYTEIEALPRPLKDVLDVEKDGIDIVDDLSDKALDDQFDEAMGRNKRPDEGEVVETIGPDDGPHEREGEVGEYDDPPEPKTK